MPCKHGRSVRWQHARMLCVALTGWDVLDGDHIAWSARLGQGATVHLETANAALLEGAADSWEAALGEGASWRLVALLTPDA